MPKKEDLKFGLTMSDHMLTIKWSEAKGGWHAPEIVPYQNLSISPAASSLHYGLECFEGMKAYKSLDGDDPASLRLFRPDKNMTRLKNSMSRLSLPGCDFESNELINCLKSLVRLDSRWIPEGEGYSLYIRPTVIATHPFLGVAPPSEILLYVITCPVGPYYKGGFEPVRLTADTEFVRAWPGGTGQAKVAGNYGPTMKASSEAAERGYDQVLWLFGEEKYVTEVGAMNVFFLVEGEDGVKELVTPPLTRGDILPGVTRASIVELVAKSEDYKVTERNITMKELQEKAHQGKLLEAFGAGTAAVVCPIKCIQYEGKDIDIPATGHLTKLIWKQLTDIQYGKVQHPWSVIV
eukprot:CAMPEP_0172518740 /NCGR_PEP_ID=MMETSP1066-20121228/290996_1 /TAXON_ID=671091 /ORGANISM="Coscinodiscus wailesii, Strain CCMP2513" /LENGTH=349 /DNA_ID=CAMNT_0013301183 /DNA_START=237 /DNA_END=1286 /DNA_ORIENTATION=-